MAWKSLPRSVIAPAASCSAPPDRIVARWAHWSRTAADVGVQTRQVLGYVPDDVIAGSAGVARAASAALHERTGQTAGNGSLMRTAPVALAYLDDPAGLAEAALALSGLTHFDPAAGEACVLWSLAIRHAVLTGELDARAGFGHLPAGSQGTWGARLDAAEKSRPGNFARNGWVVEALQAAWCAIAGGLLGAAYGASAVPADWQSVLHGWPGFDTSDLIRLASQTVAA